MDVGPHKRYTEQLYIHTYKQPPPLSLSLSFKKIPQFFSSRNRTIPSFDLYTGTFLLLLALDGRQSLNLPFPFPPLSPSFSVRFCLPHPLPVSCDTAVPVSHASFFLPFDISLTPPRDHVPCVTSGLAWLVYSALCIMRRNTVTQISFLRETSGIRANSYNQIAKSITRLTNY